MTDYSAKILRVDLTDEKITTEHIDELTLKMYIGGLGVGTKILNLIDYPIPSFKDVPEFHTELVEVSDKNGPFGARGVGESSISSVFPAIANAVYKAIGVRIRDLPITQEKILKALRR